MVKEVDVVAVDVIYNEMSGHDVMMLLMEPGI